MRAAVLVEQGEESPLEIMEFPGFPILQVGQVLVQVKYAGICGAQLREMSGVKGPDPYLPHMLGHEGSGIVKAVGAGVKKVKQGDTVVLHWRKGSGIGASPAVWTSQKGRKVGSGPVTCFSEYTIVSENRITPFHLPDQNQDDFFQIAALMGCAVTTGFGIINNEAQLKIGQSLLLIGLGGVGFSVLKAAKMVSAGRIEVCEIDKTKYSVGEMISPLTSFSASISNRVFDVVVDTTGNPEMIQKGLEATAPGGKLILCGQPPHYASVNFPNMSQHYQGKTIMDSQGGRTNPDADIFRYLKLAEMGKVDFTCLIGTIGTLEQINQIIADMRRGRAIGRCLIRM